MPTCVSAMYSTLFPACSSNTPIAITPNAREGPAAAAPLPPPPPPLCRGAADGGGGGGTPGDAPIPPTAAAEVGAVGVTGPDGRPPALTQAG